jgi:hypothetical protein
VHYKEHNETTVYPFDTKVQTPFFSATIEKHRPLTQTVYVKLHGSKRHIYESIVKKSLLVTQLKLETNLIKVAFKDTIPERANAYLDALVNVYIKRSIKKKDSIIWDNEYELYIEPFTLITQRTGEKAHGFNFPIRQTRLIINTNRK